MPYIRCIIVSLLQKMNYFILCISQIVNITVTIKVIACMLLVLVLQLLSLCYYRTLGSKKVLYHIKREGDKTEEREERGYSLCCILLLDILFPIIRIILLLFMHAHRHTNCPAWVSTEGKGHSHIIRRKEMKQIIIRGHFEETVLHLSREREKDSRQLCP